MITPPTDFYLDALREAHEGHLRVRLYSAGTLIGPLLVSSCSLSIDGRAETWRTANLSVGVDFWESETREWLEQANVQTGEVRIDHGISLHPGMEPVWVQLARLRIDSLNMSLLAAGRSITAYDRALLLSEHVLTGEAFPLNATYLVLINRLLHETLPSETLTVHSSVSTTKTPAPGKSLAMGANRLTEIQSMASALDAYFVNLPSGGFYLGPLERMNDPTGVAPIVPVWDVDDGENGVLVDLAQSFARAEQYNGVGITFTPNADTTTTDWIPVTRWAFDLDPDSPTYFHGPFGKRTIIFDEEYDHLPSVAEATAVAIRKLGEYTGATRGLAITAIYNPLLQPGDQISVTFPETNEVETHIVESVGLSLGGASTMSIETRLKRDETAFVALDHPPEAIPMVIPELSVPPHYLERV